MARRLTRNSKEAILAGVAAGFGDHFDVDPVMIRLAFIFLCFFGGTGFALYIVAWVLMPRDVDLAPATAGAAAAGGSGASSGMEGGAEATADAAGSRVPPVDRMAKEAAAAGDRIAREAAQAGERVVQNLRQSLPRRGGRARLIGGLILIFLGAIFLADRIMPYHWWWIGDMWPLFLVVIGVMMIVGAARRGD